MRKLFDVLKKQWALVVLLVIISGAVFVRVHKFDEWLYFKMDQSRDALLMTTAVEKGPGYLPLLGPRVGAVKLQHGFLRVGPIYYYFQYLSGKIFNATTPPVFAYPDLFFSIAVLPALYLFVRLYFNKRHSLFITAMYAFSFLIIQYSRFAWNPNSLQFFIIASFYGLLRFLNETRPVPKKWWLVLWATGIAIGSQLHFFGFFSLLGISGLLILFHFRMWEKSAWQSFFERESLRRFAVFAGIVLAVFVVFYAPVVVSDSMKNWQNTKNFFEALGAKAEKKPILEKLQKDVKENLNYYCLLTTSECYNPSITKNIVPISISGLIVLFGLLISIRKLRNETDPLARDFLMLTLLWFGVFSILTLPVAFQLRPRFYIVVFALPFIFLGFLYEFLESRFGRKLVPVSFLITGAILAINARGTAAWFTEQADAQVKPTEAKRTLILKAKDGVTLGQLQGATDWMYARLTPGNTLYYYIKPEHVRPINFLLTEKKGKKLHFSTMKINEDPHAQFFAIEPVENGIGSVRDKFGDNLQVVDSKAFGELLVSEIDIPNRVTSNTFVFKKESGSEDRIYWKDVFSPKQKK